MIRVMQTGRNPTMKHLGRVHRVDIGWMHARFAEPCIVLVYERSAYMAADIYTKAFTDKDKWNHACLLINIVDPSDLNAIGIRLQHLAEQRILDEEEALAKERERAGIVGHDHGDEQEDAAAAAYTANPKSRAISRRPRHTRTIIEICTSEDSELGLNTTSYATGCWVIRITETDDFLNDHFCQCTSSYYRAGRPYMDVTSLYRRFTQKLPKQEQPGGRQSIC